MVHLPLQFPPPFIFPFLGSDLKEGKIKIEGERESPTGNKNSKCRNRGQDVDVLTGYNTGFF